MTFIGFSVVAIALKRKTENRWNTIILMNKGFQRFRSFGTIDFVYRGDKEYAGLSISTIGENESTCS
jgi:hypothetical protein